MSTSNSNEISPSPSPFNAPKFGTLVPNRIFVGGIAGSTTEEELYDLFSQYGCVKEAKIIADRAGVSKGYGFVTFENEEDARRIQKEDNIVLRERKLNIAPAIKKQPFSRVYGSPSAPPERVGTPRQSRGSADWNVVAATQADPAPVVPNGTVFYHNGAAYYSPTGVVFAPSETTCQYTQPQTYYQMMYSPTAVYIPQQYQPYQTATAQAQWTGQPVRWTAQVGGYGQSTSTHVSTSSSTTASTASQYMYSSSSTCGGGQTTPTTSAGQGSGSMGASTLAQMQQQAPPPPPLSMGDSSANVGVAANTAPMTTSTMTYSYPPPSMLAQYQPQQCGAGDVTEQMPIMEAAPVEQTAQNTQDSAGPAKPANSTGLGAVVHFVHAWPFPPPPDSEDCRLVAAAAGTSTFAQGPFHKGYNRRPHYQPGGSPRKMHPTSYGMSPQTAYRYSPQRRGKSRPPMGHHQHHPAYYHQPYGGGATATAIQVHTATMTNGGSSVPTTVKNDVPPNGLSNSPLTPPPTPMTTAPTSGAATMVITETTHRFKSLNL